MNTRTLDAIPSMLNDKHYLAVLAIPILLSMVLGLSTGPYADTALASQDRAESEGEVSDANDVREESRHDERSPLRYQDGGPRTGDGKDKRNEIGRAIESGDYGAFLAATKGTPFAEVMTPDVFAILVQKYHEQRGFHPSHYLLHG